MDGAVIFSFKLAEILLLSFSRGVRGIRAQLRIHVCGTHNRRPPPAVPSSKRAPPRCLSESTRPIDANVMKAGVVTTRDDQECADMFCGLVHGAMCVIVLLSPDVRPKRQEKKESTDLAPKRERLALTMAFLWGLVARIFFFSFRGIWYRVFVGFRCSRSAADGGVAVAGGGNVSGGGGVMWNASARAASSELIEWIVFPSTGLLLPGTR